MDVQMLTTYGKREERKGSIYQLEIVHPNGRHYVIEQEQFGLKITCVNRPLEPESLNRNQVRL